ncbi:MAG: amidohydrolase family protein, partial [Acidobacteria bacterium]|nr:amidohydrolase family protein [Acidobacteriota bacterium]
DVSGYWIFAGFVEPYSEYGLGHVEDLNADNEQDEPQYEADRTGTTAWSDAIHAHRNWVADFRPDAEAAEALMKRGVTATVSAKMDGIFRGRSFVASVADGEPNDLVLEDSGLHFASFDPGSSQLEYPSSLMGSIAVVRQTLLDAEWYRAAHAAWNRDPSQRRPESNVAIAALADETAAETGTLVFETGDEQSLLRAGRISREFDVPMIHLGSNAEYRRIDEVAALGQEVILPLSFPEAPGVASYEDQLDVTLADLRHWERAPSNPAVLEAAGVRFALTGHGLREDEDFLTNLRQAVERGLSADGALAALTTVPAEMAGVGDQVGRLEAGMRADFILADGDLFAGEASILSVWIGGEMAHEEVDLDRTDLRGTYSATLDDIDYRLTVGGELDALEGTIAAEGVEYELSEFSSAPGRLSFQADFDELGVARVSLIQLADSITALVATPDGALHNVRLVPVDPDDAETEGEGGNEGDAGEPVVAETTGAETMELVSRSTLPPRSFGHEKPPAREDVLIVGATVWTNEEEGVLEEADLLIRGGRIAAVGVDLEAPEGVRVIDAFGKHVTPGMIDEHAHIAISRGVNEGSHAVTAEVRIGDVVNPDHIGIYRALAGGTTTAQLLHGSANPIGGQAQVIKLRWGASAEGMKLDSAPPSIKFALGENVKQSNWGDDHTSRYPQSRMGVETIMRDRFLVARDYQKAWDDYRELSSSARASTVPPRRDLQLETLVEILHSERFVHCHSYSQSEILMLMRLAEDLGFRIQTFTHILEGYKVAPEMAAHGAGASTFADWWAYKFEVYDAIPQNTCLMHEAGVVTSINSDSSDLIRRLNQEAAKSVMHCGMDEEDALKLATLNPAIQLKIDDRVGSLKPGKDADFVIWNGHPLSMYSKVEQTWVEGVNSFSLERDLALRAADRAEKQALIQKILREAKGDEEDESSGDGERDDEEWNCEEVLTVWY